MWSNFLLVTLLVICVITDLIERKIYNKVLFPFLAAAWIFPTITGGIHGFTAALLGTFVGICILIIPYLLGGMGAGDVKLLAVIGGLKGASFVLWTSLYMALAGGMIAILVLTFRKGLMKRMLYLIFSLFQGMSLSFVEDKHSMTSAFPYGVAIAAGAVYQLLFPGALSL